MTPEQKQERLQLAEQILDEQNFWSGFVFGFIAMLAAIGIWVLIVVVTGSRAAFMAVFVGLMAGYAIRVFGKGIEARYAVLAALFALLGSLLGSLLAALLREILVFGLTLSEIPEQLNSGPLLKWILADVSLLTLAFWIISISAAAYLANRRLNHVQALALFAYRHQDTSRQET